MQARGLLLLALAVITALLLITNYFGSTTGEEGASTEVSSINDRSLGSSPENVVEAAADAVNETGHAEVANPQAQAIAGQADLASSANTNQSVLSSDDTDESPPSPNTDAPALSERVYFIIDEAQRQQLAGDWEAALLELNALYTDFDSMTPFEQSTLLNFYTNTLIRMEMWQESITAFSLLLTVDDLRPDVTARALLSLGQLHDRVDETVEAEAYYREWLVHTRDMGGLEEQTARVEQRLNR